MDRLKMWLAGRYGADHLARFLTVAALILFVLALPLGQAAALPLAGPEDPRLLRLSQMRQDPAPAQKTGPADRHLSLLRVAV